MNRPLRVGDRVTATGTVGSINGLSPETGAYLVTVRWDRPDDMLDFADVWADTLTLIAPAEPPVGSVVVKDGVAWTRCGQSWLEHDGIHATWDDISDGEVIFVPGGEW